MINWLYVIYALAVYAYTGNEVIDKDRGMVIFFLGFPELIIDSLIIILIYEICERLKK